MSLICGAQVLASVCVGWCTCERERERLSRGVYSDIKEDALADDAARGERESDLLMDAERGGFFIE